MSSFALSEEHEALREAVRALADDKIAAGAADVIEEVARACATSPLIPAVNKLGTMPLLLGASEEVKQRYLPLVARGDGMVFYALFEPEAGSDAVARRTR